jgi:hypothetical protein
MRYMAPNGRVLLSARTTGYSGLLRGGRSGDRVPVGAKFSAPVHIDPGVHPASSTLGTGSVSRE